MVWDDEAPVALRDSAPQNVAANVAEVLAGGQPQGWARVPWASQGVVGQLPDSSRALVRKQG